MSVLERYPSCSEKHLHPTRRVKSLAYCGRVGSNKHKNGLLEQSKDLTDSCISWNHHCFISQHDLHTMSDKGLPIWAEIFSIFGCVRLKRSFSIEILCWDMEKCPSYRGVRLTIVRLTEVFLWETHLRSAGTCWNVRLREVSVLWDVRLKRFHCTQNEVVV